EVFGKVLAKKADDRYQSGAEFVHDLEYCLGSWFGSLEDTLVSTPEGAVPERTATLARIAAPPLPDPQPEPTAPMSIPDLKPPPVRRPTPTEVGPARPRPPAIEEDTSTVVMKSLPAPGDEPTILLSPRPVVRAATAPAADAESATVVFKAAPPPPAAGTKTNPPGPAHEGAPPTRPWKAGPPPLPPRTSD